MTDIDLRLFNRKTAAEQLHHFETHLDNIQHIVKMTQDTLKKCSLPTPDQNLGYVREAMEVIKEKTRDALMGVAP